MCLRNAKPAKKYTKPVKRYKVMSVWGEPPELYPEFMFSKPYQLNVEAKATEDDPRYWIYTLKTKKDALIYLNVATRDSDTPMVIVEVIARHPGTIGKQNSYGVGVWKNDKEYDMLCETFQFITPTKVLKIVKPKRLTQWNKYTSNMIKRMIEKKAKKAK